jgi:hypothetical protein
VGEPGYIVWLMNDVFQQLVELTGRRFEEKLGRKLAQDNWDDLRELSMLMLENFGNHLERAADSHAAEQLLDELKRTADVYRAHHGQSQ